MVWPLDAVLFETSKCTARFFCSVQCGLAPPAARTWTLTHLSNGAEYQHVSSEADEAALRGTPPRQVINSINSALALVVEKADYDTDFGGDIFDAAATVDTHETTRQAAADSLQGAARNAEYLSASSHLSRIPSAQKPAIYQQSSSLPHHSIAAQTSAGQQRSDSAHTAGPKTVQLSAADHRVDSSLSSSSQAHGRLDPEERAGERSADRGQQRPSAGFGGAFAIEPHPRCAQLAMLQILLRIPLYH